VTERLYYTDAGLLEFEAVVRDIIAEGETARVRLDRSAFYPTSGGQLFDTGVLGGTAVVDVTEVDNEVWHFLSIKPGFGVGDTVTGKIDHERRRDNMQKHTGQHILSQSFITVCGAETVSSRLGEEDCTIDLNREQIGDAEIDKAELQANQIIFENRPVIISVVAFDALKSIPLRKIPQRQEGDFRIITIDGFDWSACGGTHCRATGSVGLIKLTAREKIRGTIRLHFLTGISALADYSWRYTQIETMANLFTRHGRESVIAAKQIMEENSLLRKKLALLKRELLPTKVESWVREGRDIAGIKVVAFDYSGEDTGDAKEAALAIINHSPVLVMIGCGDKLFIGAGKGVKCSAKDVLAKVVERFGGRGGGSPQLAQGGGFRTEDIKVLLADPALIMDI
jgi:alanyl-tRNA synthetase